MKTIANPDFDLVWRQLHRFATSKGVEYKDVEDLVSISIVKGLDVYDESKGALLPFCLTILSNNIKNFWRSSHPTQPLPDDLFDEDSPFDRLAAEEEIVDMRNKIKLLSILLTVDEHKFMLKLGEVIDELGHRAVSETASQLGYTPLQGHDILRRIKRKAAGMIAPLPPGAPVEGAYVSKQAPPELRSEESDAVSFQQATVRSVSYAPSMPGDDSLFELAKALSHRASIDRLLASLNRVEIKRLASVTRLFK